MKKLIFVITILILNINFSFGQWMDLNDGNISWHKGNIGIGTSTPIKKLHIVYGKGTLPKSILGEGLMIQNNLNSGAQARLYLFGKNDGFSIIDFGDDNSSMAGQIVYNHLNNLMSFSTNNNSDRMVINADGNIGIGTTTPTAKLDIIPTGTQTTLNLGRISGQPSIKTTTDAGGYLMMESNGGKLGLNWYVPDNVIIALGGGKVGVGTNTPSALLEIKSKANNHSELHINTETNGKISIIRFQDAGTSTWGFLSNYPSEGKFSLYNYQRGKRELVFDANGNLGLGTDNPGYKLDVAGTINATDIKINGESISGGSSVWSTSGTNIYRSSGNVGIGTTNPLWQLTVKDIITINGSNNQKLHIRPNSGYDGYIYWAENGVAERGILGFKTGSGDLVYRSGATNFSNGTERFRITSNGNVGIGTTNPQSLLAVNGIITTKEVNVTLEGWSDFVFEKDYKLKTLAEVENFIETNKHLPDVPSENEVLKNGVSLGEMNSVLLQKIEELTLYIIEQNKSIEQLKKDNSEIRNDINKLKK
ncbi:MAG: hypothetical protein KAT68_18585 [Bacteroidales bacterium]|nr:hypothetical protein [Bacteroidales bacterium]